MENKTPFALYFVDKHQQTPNLFTHLCLCRLHTQQPYPYISRKGEILQLRRSDHFTRTPADDGQIDFSIFQRFQRGKLCRTDHLGVVLEDVVRGVRGQPEPLPALGVVGRKVLPRIVRPPVHRFFQHPGGGQGRNGGTHREKHYLIQLERIEASTERNNINA